MSEEFSIPQEFYKFAVLVTIKVENISIFSILSSNNFSILDEKNIFDKYDIFWNCIYFNKILKHVPYY